MCAADALGAEEAGASAAREELCRCLAECFFAPGADLEAEPFFESMQAAAARLGGALASHCRQLAQAYAQEGLTSIAAEHARLFRSANPALPRPHAAPWLAAASPQAAPIDVAALYEEADFLVDSGYEEPLDHVAVELEFLYLLIHRENQALRRLDAAALHATQGWRRTFLQTHLSRWLPAYLRSLALAARSPFYRTLAESTTAYLQLEMQHQADALHH